MSAPSTCRTERTGIACIGNPPLTHSEERVARLVAHGYTNREIAARLFLSHHTVDTHVRHIYQKLQVRSRVALTRLILRVEPANA
jgi:DNA-binding CsgD family transcriptional regulator